MINSNVRNAILALAVLSVGSFWLARQVGEQDQGPIEGFDADLNYALRNFEFQSYDQLGRPAFLVRSSRFTSNTLTGEGWIEEPQMEVHQEGFLWHIIADSATVTNDREYVHLKGEVDIYRSGPSNNDWLAMSSSEVTLEVTPRIARSDTFVEVMDNSSRMTATGFTIDMRSNQYHLQRDVKGSYAID